MRASVSVVMITAGAILAFAVSGHPSFLDIQLAGAIVMVTGLVGLWPLGGRAWVAFGRGRLRQFVDQTPPVDGARVPLDELLGRARPQPDVWAPHAGHHQARGSVPTRSREVTTDDQASEPAQARQCA
jgi:hypothetical protein